MQNGKGLDTSPERKIIDGLLEEQSGEMTLWGKRSVMDEDCKRQRKMEDSGGGLLPAMERHSLE